MEILFFPVLQKKSNGAPNGFYAEIDWDRYVSARGPLVPRGCVRVCCGFGSWAAVGVQGRVLMPRGLSPTVGNTP